MKHIVLVFFLLSVTCYSYSQMIMSAEGVVADNVCKPNNIYFLTGLNEESRAKPVEAIETIQKRLNETISFARNNSSFEGKPAIQFAVNCKGEIGGGFHIVTKSGNDELDKELMEFFNTVKEWNAGKINKKKTVDSWYMWRLEIKNGSITILNR